MIRQYPDSCLSAVCTPYSPEETALAFETGRKLLDVLARYHRAGIGLAAPQIGITRRVFVLDTGYLKIDAGSIFINPTIMWASEDTEIEQEGCLSLPQDVVVDVRRPVSISLSYDTMDREGVMVELHGMAARAAQHEMDHLEGKGLWELVSRQVRRKIERAAKK